MDTIGKKLKFEIFTPIVRSILNTILGNQSEKTTVPSHLPASFFITGSGRNGSTLLALILNRHSKIFLPPEQYALPAICMKWQIYRHYNWDKYCKASIHHFAISNQDWKLGNEDYSAILHKLRKTEKQFQNPETVLSTVMNYYAQKAEKSATICSDHSPSVTEYYKHTYCEFPRSKQIFLIRHPMDVILSYSKMKNHPASNSEYAAWKWNNSIKAFDYREKHSDAPVCLVHYENLVTNTESEISRILEFLNLPGEDISSPRESERQDDTLGTGSREHHKHLYNPITDISVGKWRAEINAEIINKSVPLVAKNAKRFGYNIELKK